MKCLNCLLDSHRTCQRKSNGACDCPCGHTHNGEFIPFPEAECELCNPTPEPEEASK